MLTVYTVMSFSSGLVGGNSAGICLTSEALSNEVMQGVATRVGYSETVFIKLLGEKDIQMRYFTPSEEVDLCGHATIAGFHWLLEHRHIEGSSFRLITGRHHLSIEVVNGIFFMEQPKVILERVMLEDYEHIYELSQQICKDQQLYKASTGIVDLMLPFNDEQSLENYIPDFIHIARVCKTIGVQGIHAYAKAGEGVYSVRNFAPLLGIDEESATGTSNCALSGLLYHQGTTRDSFIFKQGMWMQQPSIILTKRMLENQFSVGGSAYTVNDKTIQVTL